MAASQIHPSPELQLSTEKKPDQIIIRAAGRIAAGNADYLQNTIRAVIPETKRIVLDLTGIDYVDSSGLGALFSIYVHADKAGCVLELANPKQRVRDLFHITKLSSVFQKPGENEWGVDLSDR